MTRIHYRNGFTDGYEAAFAELDALVDRQLAELIDAALAAEERAAKAAKEGTK